MAFFTTSVSRKRQQLAGTNTMKKREEKNKTHKLSSHIRFNVTLRTLDKNNRQKEMPKHRKSNFQNKHRESATSNNHSIHMPTKSVIIPIKKWVIAEKWQVGRQRSFEPASCERSEASVYDLPLLCICARRWWEAFGCQRWEITAIFQHKQMAMGWKSAILKASIWSVLRTNLIFTAYWIAADIEKGKNFTDFQKFPVKRPQRDNKNRPEKKNRMLNHKNIKLVTKKWCTGDNFGTEQEQSVRSRKKAGWRKNRGLYSFAIAVVWLHRTQYSLFYLLRSQ